MSRIVHILVAVAAMLALPVVAAASNDAAGREGGTAASGAAQLLKWEVLAAHGEAGQIGAEITDDYVESRCAGIARLRLTFSGPIDSATLGVGAIDVRGQIGGDLSDMVIGLWLEKDDAVLVVQLADALDDGDRYELTLGDQVRAFDGRDIGGIKTRKLAALVGDIDGSGEVDDSDVVALQAQAGLELGGETARLDVNCDGRFGPADEQLVHKHIGHALPKAPKIPRE